MLSGDRKSLLADLKQRLPHLPDGIFRRFQNCPFVIIVGDVTKPKVKVIARHILLLPCYRRPAFNRPGSLPNADLLQLSARSVLQIAQCRYRIAAIFTPETNLEYRRLRAEVAGQRGLARCDMDQHIRICNRLLRTMTHYLQTHTVAATCQADEMRHVLVDVYDARLFGLSDRSVNFTARAGYFDFGSANLSYCSYGAPVHLQFRDDPYVRLQFCLAGSGRTKIGSREVDVDSQRVICSPAEAKFDLGKNFEQFALRIKREAIEEDVAFLLGARPKQRLCLGDAQTYGAPQAKRLRDLVISTAKNIDLSAEPIPRPLLREIEGTIRLAVLYGVQSNLSDLLHECSKPAPPWQVARVEEWIEANWTEDVSIERLAALTGAGARSIFLAFKKARGYTPMAYLKAVRLKAARNMLLQPAPGISVTGVSFACNFMNPSHFARDYRREFGELPSVTLQRTKSFKS